MPLGTTLIGFRGLPLAISISTVTLFVTMLVAVGPRLPGLDPVGILAGGARVALAGVVALGVAQAAAAVAPGGAVGILIVAGTCGAVAYAVALMLVSRDDARLALDFVAPWLGRPRPASAWCASSSAPRRACRTPSGAPTARSGSSREARRFGATTS